MSFSRDINSCKFLHRDQYEGCWKLEVTVSMFTICKKKKIHRGPLKSNGSSARLRISTPFVVAGNTSALHTPAAIVHFHLHVFTQGTSAYLHPFLAAYPASTSILLFIYCGPLVAL